LKYFNSKGRVNQNTIYPNSMFTTAKNGMVISTYPGKAVMPDAYQTSAGYPNLYPANPYNNGNMFAPGYNNGNMFASGYNYPRY